MITRKALEKFTNNRLEEIALDFIVNDLTRTELRNKYNLSVHTLKTIIEELDLQRKKAKYQKKILDKSLERCATYQSKIIAKSTDILNDHIERIYTKQKRKNSKDLKSSDVRDILSILQVISKEQRLDLDKPTENIISQVKVVFPEGFTPITQRPPDIVVESKEENIEEIEEVTVEIDENVLENPFD